MIVVNDAFVYIHSPKTGGTFVTKMLHKVAADNAGFRITELPDLKHAGVNKIPEEYQRLPVVINVRNVFEHYVSRYTFRWWAEPNHSKNMFDLDRVAKYYPEFPNLTFSQFLRFFNQYSLRRKMPHERKAKLTQHKIGLNTWVLTRLTTAKPMKLIEQFDLLNEEELNSRFQGIHFLRTENLNADLFELLKKNGADEDKIKFILKAPAILPKKGGRGTRKLTWQQYFNQEDIDFVVKHDRLHFRLFPDMMPD